MEFSQPYERSEGSNSKNIDSHSQTNRVDQYEIIEMNNESGQKIDGADSDATIDTWYENEYVVEKVIGHRFANVSINLFNLNCY